MSINKIYLPELKVLVSYLNENGTERFYNRYARNHEVMMGPAESIEFVHNFLTEYTNNENTKVL